MRTLAPAVFAVLAVLTAAGCGDNPSTPSVTSSTSAPAATSSAPAPEPSPSPTPSKTTFLPVGTMVTVNPTSGPAVQLEVTVSKARWAAVGCNGTAKPEQQWAIVDVTVKVVAGTGSINPFNFELITTDGQNVSMATGIFAGCKALPSGNDFPPGTAKTGQLVFDAKRGGSLLEYKLVPSAVLASWEIPG